MGWYIHVHYTRHYNHKTTIFRNIPGYNSRPYDVIDMVVYDNSYTNIIHYMDSTTII